PPPTSLRSRWNWAASRRRSSAPARASSMRSNASCSASWSMPGRPASRPITCCCRAPAWPNSSTRPAARWRGCIRSWPRAGSTPASFRIASISVWSACVMVPWLPAQLLGNVTDEMAVMREEIFGPLLPLLPYDTLDEAIAYVTAHPHPLALYLFEQDAARIEKVLSNTHAGGVSVNDTIYHIAQHDLPFGGVGNSGTGGYHGEAGFRTFSHIKPV